MWARLTCVRVGRQPLCMTALCEFNVDMVRHATTRIMASTVLRRPAAAKQPATDAVADETTAPDAGETGPSQPPMGMRNGR